jgi:hypothetical protein
MSPYLHLAGVVLLLATGTAADAGSELDAWTKAKAADTCAAWRGFVAAYPDGKLAGMARIRLDACATDAPTPPMPPSTTTESAGATGDAGADRPAAPAQLPPAAPVIAPSAVPAAEQAGAEPFIVLPTSDGFVAVRREPTTAATEMGRRYPDQRLACTGVVRGQRLRYGDRWVHCPEAGGYLYATLVTPDLNGARARRLVVRATSDGFVAVRSAATTSRGHRIAKLTAGQVVHCDRLVQGERLTRGAYWLSCPDVGGYIHAPLLIPD